MNETTKTRQELIDEVAALKERVSQLEAMEREAGQAQRDFGERMGRFFPQEDHMREAIYVIFDRKYEFINNQFEEMFHVTSEEVCQQGFDPMRLVAPESRDFIQETYRKASRGGFSDLQYEFTGMTKDGAKIDCEAFVLFIPYKWGIAIHGMLRNISVQKRIDEELQRNRTDLQIVLNSIPASIFYTDREHRFVQANKAFCKTLGFPLERIIGKTFTELFPNLPAEQLSHYFEVSNQVIASGVSKRGFIEILPSVRGRRWIQNDRMPYRDDEGNIVGVICLAIDISDLRETEEKLWYLSFHDVLTGLYNRTYCEEELSRLEKGRQFPISIIAIKVDDLLTVNESEGIDAGNDLLKRTAAILKMFRNEDLVARTGGDRFAAIMPSSDQSIGDNVLLRLRMSIEAHNKRHKGRPLNLSTGLATGEKGCSMLDLLTRSEAAIG